jgi:hypothetical protein
MNDDERLRHLLRAALPAAASLPPCPDLWPLMESRLDASRPKSWVDLALLVVVALLLLLVPDWLFLMAFQL